METHTKETGLITRKKGKEFTLMQIQVNMYGLFNFKPAPSERDRERAMLG